MSDRERIYVGEWGFAIEFYVDGPMPSGTIVIHYVKPDGSDGTLTPTSVSGPLVTLVVPNGFLNQKGTYTFYLVASDGASFELVSTPATLRVHERGE